MHTININNLVTINGVSFYTFSPLNKFCDRIVHGFSTRKGGTSSPPYDSLNLGLHVEDNEETVIANRKKIIGVLGFSIEDAIALNQVHGNKIVKIDKCSCGKELSSADGMITNQPNILLMTHYADCVPIYVYDPVSNSIGLAHAGWKGTVLKVAKNLVEELNNNYGVKPKNCIAVIGPSIGSCCYQVNEKVIGPLKKSIPRWRECLVDEDFLNLWWSNKLVLQESGIKNQNIYISRLCTSCEVEDFYSHRRDKGTTGRMAAFLAIRG